MESDFWEKLLVPQIRQPSHFFKAFRPKKRPCSRHQIVKSYTQFTIQDPELNILVSDT